MPPRLARGRQEEESGTRILCRPHQRTRVRIGGGVLLTAPEPGSGGGAGVGAGRGWGGGGAPRGDAIIIGGLARDSSGLLVSVCFSF
jgi:hypothetical protein